MSNPVVILGIESSCDDTGAAILREGKIYANIVASQSVHKDYGGVVPELASRAHQQNIVPVVHEALKKAGVDKSELSAIAFTRGPGLLGSLLVGTSFAKSLALGLDIPLLEINHMHAHIIAHFIESEEENNAKPRFPFLCLTVSGGHTEIVLVEDHLKMKVIGRTNDDAAGEAFDKAAKTIGLDYPGGPLIDQLAHGGDPFAFKFPHPKAKGYDYSFSGLKTAFLYFIRDRMQEDSNFIKKNKADICASIQHTIVEVLLKKLIQASDDLGIKEIAISGGVAANSKLRKELLLLKKSKDWSVYIPKIEFCTDNAAMIAMTGYYKYLNGNFASQNTSASARYTYGD